MNARTLAAQLEHLAMKHGNPKVVLYIGNKDVEIDSVEFNDDDGPVILIAPDEAP